MDYVLSVLTLVAIWVIAVQGYTLIKGVGGLLHLGHPVVYGLGAYASALLSKNVLPAGSYPMDVLLSALVAVAGAVVIGWPALRARGRYFMLVTFSVQLMFFTLVSNLHGLTGGPDGITRIPRVAFGSWVITSELGTLVFVCVMAALSYAFCHFVIRSPYGRLVRAVREDEITAEAFGKHPMWVKLSIFAIGAGVTGVAGSLFAHYLRYVGPTQFGLDLVVLFLVMLVLGGQYNLLGATVGAIMVGVMIEGLRFAPLPHSVAAYLHQVVFGSILIAILFLRSDGLFRERFPRYRLSSISGRQGSPDGPTRLLPGTDRGLLLGAPEKLSQPAALANIDAHLERVDRVQAGPVVLEARGLLKHFGGVAAIKACDLELVQGRITAIIGPNGAGKTTVFNLVTGFVKPEAGEIYYRSQRITGLSPAQVAKYGIGRTFQDVRIWPKLTVIENILVAIPGQIGEHPLLLGPSLTKVWRQERENAEVAWCLLLRFGIEQKANDLGAALSYAQQKMLSLARLTALNPGMMLLDEPTAGVDLRRLGVFLDHIRAFAEEYGKTVCLIEHNMDVVREVADWVLFMNEGRIVASGTPKQVLGDKQLMSVYFGHSTVGV